MSKYDDFIQELADQGPEQGLVDLDTYQVFVDSVAVYPSKGDNYVYPALGLSGEVGEVSEKLKKAIRDEGGALSPERRDALKKELGDVLWYLAAISNELNMRLADVLAANVDKLSSRKARGVLQGSGDDR